MFNRWLKRILAYIVASALGGGGIACGQVLVGDGPGDLQHDVAAIDSASKAIHITVYNISGSKDSEGTVASFQAATTAFTPPATPTDVLSINGSILRIVRVLRIGFSSTQTTAGTNDWFVVKRSTPNAGGLGITITSIPNDRVLDGASVLAQVQAWSANPSPLGNLVGIIWHAAVYTPLPLETNEEQSDDIDSVVGGAVIDFKRIYGEPMVLRDNQDSIALNFNGAALPTGLSVRAWVEWTEDTK